MRVAKSQTSFPSNYCTLQCQDDGSEDPASMFAALHTSVLKVDASLYAPSMSFSYETNYPWLRSDLRGLSPSNICNTRLFMVIDCHRSVSGWGV